MKKLKVHELQENDILISCSFQDMLTPIPFFNEMGVTWLTQTQQ